jgi:hypothetical protein
MNGDPTQKYRKTDTRSSIKPGLANGEAVQSAGRAGNTDCVKLNVPDFSASSNSTLRNVSMRDNCSAPQLEERGD